MPEQYTDAGHPSSEDQQTILLEDLLTCQPLARIGRYLGGIIHNLNGRLQNIQMQVELLQISLSAPVFPPCPEPAGSRLQNVMDELDHMSEMLRFWGRQVDYERLQSEGPVDLNQILHEALAFMKADLFFKHQVSTEVRLEEDLPPVYGSAFAFAGAFGALLENAVDAMRESDQRHLVVSTRKDGVHALAAIEDSGCGLEQEMGDLSSPCFIGRPGRTQDQVGIRLQTRLGLCFATRAFGLYGGAIVCKSRPGKSIFTVYLPLHSNTET